MLQHFDERDGGKAFVAQVGLEQVITVGPMSGKSNVTYFLEKRGIVPTEEQVAKVLELAKQTPRMLTEAEILAAAGVKKPLAKTR